MNKEFLPIGSVVLLKGGTKKIMITGFCYIDKDNSSEVYDYTGCLYPEGIINSNEINLFNNEQIEKVFFKGFEDDEEFNFKKVLSEVITEYENNALTVENDADEPVVMYQSESTEKNNMNTEESFE